ncbi:polysaccharide biosynthesis protein [Alphaproteobacteria bacterium]|jgi:UDP-N-acetylglucosamine 4,6-dehydratase/5-epimerase|nr:polysaccharide biosynthesis protein [Alphaproteobacteria bacterium]
MFKNEVLLISGGTGSFGKAVLRRFLNTDVKEIRIFSRDEKKQEDLRISLNNEKLQFYIGDVREKSSLRAAMKGVDYVFHAAALKQVPSCEFHPMEAFKTNVIGTQNVLKVASKNNVKRVVVLSTDKAVYPINAMGISKAMAEKVMVAEARTQNKTETVFCATRYGNVMASRGSVIPLFVSQIKNGGKVTLTDPNMTRFLMSLESSVDLVLFALQNGQQGDIFIQKAPASTVADLATALSEIFKTPINPKVIGTRHGEKLYETLISREEMARAIDLDLYYRIPADIRSLNYTKYFTEGNKVIAEVQDYTSHNTRRLDVREIKELLLKLLFIQDELHA